MACFVLVHGGFFGGWCWARVAPKLRSKGHEVYTPTLTEFGERSHLLNRDIGLSTHAEDVTNVILFEELDNVLLLGHSYSGMVLTVLLIVFQLALSTLSTSMLSFQKMANP